jgi:F0F1-type ATP synthase assembly protein I
VTSPTPDAPEPPAGQSTPKPLPSAIAFVGMGTTVAACVAVGVVLGILVDGRLHTSPAFLLVGLMLGLGAAVATVVAQVRRFL